MFPHKPEPQLLETESAMGEFQTVWEWTAEKRLIREKKEMS